MHLGLQITAIAFMSLLTGCASLATTKASPETRKGLSPRNLMAGECGLFVWKADQAKTFILYADKDSAALYRKGAEVALTRASKGDNQAELTFIDPQGSKILLSLFQAQSFQDSTRYKSGSLTSLDENGWEIFTSVVGLYSCKT